MCLLYGPQVQQQQQRRQRLRRQLGQPLLEALSVSPDLYSFVLHMTVLDTVEISIQHMLTVWLVALHEADLCRCIEFKGHV